VSFLRERDAERNAANNLREHTAQVWRERLEMLEWSYVSEKIASEGAYNLGTTQELLHKVIQPEEAHQGVFKKEPGGASAVVGLLVRQIAQEKGLCCEIDGRNHIVVNNPPEIILTNEADAPTV
jgi:hypothetical protein